MVFTKNPTYTTTKTTITKDGTIRERKYDWRKYHTPHAKHADYLCETCNKNVSFYHKQRHFRSKKHQKNLNALEK